MFELKNLWVSFSKLFQDTQLSQVKTLSFHMALYAHTHVISFTFSLFSQTHSYTYKLQVPDTFTVRPSLKKPQSTLLSRSGSTRLTFLTGTVHTPPPPVGTLMADVQLWTQTFKVSPSLL